MRAAAPAGPPRGIVETWERLGDRVPAISRIAGWDRWVADADDADPDAAPTWEGYAAWARFEVAVDEAAGHARVVDRGTGGGSEEWTVALFTPRERTPLVGLAHAVLVPDAAEADAAFLCWEAGWRDVSAEVAPPLDARLFLSDARLAAAAEALAVFATRVVLPPGSTVISVRAVKNMDCSGGRLRATRRLDPEQAATACEVLAALGAGTVTLAFDEARGRFTVG